MTTAAAKKNIRTFTQEELIQFFIENGDKSFRAKQVHEWLWQKSADSFKQMTNLSKATRQMLEDRFTINPVLIDTYQKSKDGTIKNAFKLFDGNIVEGVLIPTSERMTACVSSQVGCSLTCKFCATGKMDRLRNLDAAEILFIWAWVSPF
jgi:23S rRNA (adenine2503-C2)-methyltransferase